jgi:dihydropteroate synthase
MGILNVTPDSFSDGGRWTDPAAAAARAVRMVEEGADIIDIGGESTRPGAEPVPVEEELRRVMPVLERLRDETGVRLSIDTRKAEVAERALASGAVIINDVSAFTHDPRMPAVAGEHRAGVVLMHMRGDPRSMQDAPVYADVVEEVRDYLAGRIGQLAAAGIDPVQMAVDPGIGFGKTLRHNLALLNRLSVLTGGERPVVVGVSRKSFLGRITGRDVDDRLVPTIAAQVWAVLQGAHVLRVHDVKDACDACRVVNILASESEAAADRGGAAG